MDEQRREPRVKLLYYLKVYNRHTRELIGQVLDITSQGFNLLCRQPLPVGAVQACVVELPGDEYRKTTVNVDIECRWRQHDDKPGYFSSGFRFSRIAPDDRCGVQQLIVDYARSANFDYLLA
jgi:hypothetical protein